MNFDIENPIIEEALLACRQAIDAHIAANPGIWYPCGFAWVRIKPARGRFVEALKERNLGQVDDYEGGLLVSPASGSTQWMDAKEIGCKAFVAVVKKHYPEMRIYVSTRID
jgi:hypothetical protein